MWTHDETMLTKQLGFTDGSDRTFMSHIVSIFVRERWTFPLWLCALYGTYGMRVCVCRLRAIVHL